MQNNSVSAKKKKKKNWPWDSPQTCGEMYVLEKMTQQRGLIAVMIHPQPDIFHKWKLAFKPGKTQKWLCQKRETNLPGRFFVLNCCIMYARDFSEGNGVHIPSARREVSSLIEEMRGTLIKFFMNFI